MLVGLPSTVLRKAEAMASTGLSHVELTVRDLERSLHFSGTSIKADQVSITHIGLWVHGLDAVYEDLKGVKFVVPPHTLIKTPTGEVRSAFSLDPDGILIQLDEIVEAKA